MTSAFFLASVLPSQRNLIDSMSRSELFIPIATVALGVLILLFGFKAYRALVVFNCIALGFWVGGILGSKAQVTTVAAVIGAVMLGAISWPLMKYAVAVCGGVVGAVVGMVVWAYFDLPLGLVWAGGLCGLILLGMFSFILFKASIILFSCIQGAAMLVLGTTAILMRYGPWQTDISQGIGKPIMIPMIVLAIAVLGVVWQQQKHGLLDGGAGAGGGSSASKSEKK